MFTILHFPFFQLDALRMTVWQLIKKIIFFKTRRSNAVINNSPEPFSGQEISTGNVTTYKAINLERLTKKLISSSRNTQYFTKT
jgi:hypothetical protein